MPEIKLSEKFHLRYFTLHIENLSDAAQKVADTLSILAIKRTVYHQKADAIPVFNNKWFVPGMVARGQ